MPVSWAAKRQTLIATSSTESEYIALFDCVQYNRNLGVLSWLLETEVPIIFCDSEPAMKICNAKLLTKKSRHFQMRVHFVKQYSDRIFCVPTELNRADPLTKLVPASKYRALFQVSDADISKAREKVEERKTNKSTGRPRNVFDTQ